MDFIQQGFQERFYPILGIPATGDEAKVVPGDHKVFYVNSAHPNANDANYGTDPEYPLATIQELIDRSTGDSSIVAPALADYDTVFVSGTVSEDVVTGDYTEMPSYVSIIGVGPTKYSPTWQGSTTANVPALDLRCVGWRISGFRFSADRKTAAAMVVLRHTDSGANDIAIRTQIDNCYFDGGTVGLYGIETHGCYDVRISDCDFTLWNNAGNTSTGIISTTTPAAVPYRQYIQRCNFYDNDNAVDCAMNGSFVTDCNFQKVGYAYTSIVVLRTSQGGNPGDDNIVTRNHFQGDYSNAGGYHAGAADDWTGNFAEDVAETEVGDNGWTIARPAA